VSAASTVARYSDDNGPIVFGCAGTPPLDVRWNPRSSACVIEVRGQPGTAWACHGEMAERVLVGLAAAHNHGRLAAAIRDLLSPQLAAHAWWDAMSRWYRCGSLLLERPARHDGGAS
jgi:hypothetical protein